MNKLLESTLSFAKNTALDIHSSWVDNGLYQGSVDSYLSNNMTNVGTLIHWTAMLSSGFVSPVQAEQIRISTSFQNDFARNIMNEAYTRYKDPNIEGIPIKSAKVSVHREVEVSDYGVITGRGYYHKNVADNAVPKPRTWDISGYLTSVWGTDIGFVLKPSLMQQAKLLDAYAQSRRPLWFKTDECEFVKVQIISFSIDRTAEIMNAYSIQVQLKEFVPLEIMTNTSGLYVAAKVQSNILH